MTTPPQPLYRVPGGSGIRGTHGRIRKSRIAARKEKIIELREQGMGLEEIRRTVGCHMRVVKEVLFSGAIRAERIQRHNEELLSFEHLSRKAIKARLEAGDADVAMWWYEKVGVVSKEQISLTINAKNAVIPINQEMIEAARLVAHQIRQAPQLPEAIPVVTPNQTEENSHGNSTIDVGGEGITE
jgi:hypothetical protein